MSGFNPSLLKQLKQSLQSTQTPCQWQRRRVHTAYCAIEFQVHAVHVTRPGKASRQLPYDKVRLFQLLSWLQPTHATPGN